MSSHNARSKPAAQGPLMSFPPILSGVLHYFPNSGALFHELSRVLTPGGYIVATMNITDVKEGFEYLYNTLMPIRLGRDKSSIIVQNLIKSRDEVLDAINSNGFVIEIRFITRMQLWMNPLIIITISLKKVMLFILKKSDR